MNQTNAISLHNVSKTYKRKRQVSFTSIFRPSRDKQFTKIRALHPVNLQIERGEAFGIIGSNGSGKSTLMNLIMGSIKPDDGGEVKVDGRIIRLALGMGMDRNLSARDNIYINGTILGLRFKRIGEIFHEIVDFAGLKDFVDVPIKLYSKGMKQRLKFAIALYAEGDIILLDEFFGGTGDKEFRAKSNQAFKDKFLDQNTVVIVSHSMKVIKNYCKRVLWLEKGKPMAIGEPDDIIQQYSEFYNK